MIAFYANAHADTREGHSYFNMTENFSADEKAFTKWTSMLVRYGEQSKIPDSECDRVPFHPCANLRDWHTIIDTLRGKSLADQMSGVNDFANAYPYIEDYVNWNVEDYWETPYEFLTVSGDCEDYAITKYYSLRLMGIPDSRLRIIIVQDMNLGGVIHAILGVYEGKELWILDNQIKQVIRAKRIYHYRPIYGINEQGWWVYHSR